MERIPLVGRETELRTLLTCMRETAAGAGGVALVEGEAGIGKTRLLQEALAAADELGLAVLRGAAHELERSRPFGPLADAFGMAVSTEAQYRTVETLLALAERRTMDGPLVVAVEDLHWADESTLVALHGMGTRLRHLPLLVVGTARPIDPGSELGRLADSLEEAGATRIPLTGLGAGDVEELAASVAGAQPGTGLRAQLTRAQGNPLFVTELVRVLVLEGLLTVDDGRAELAGSAMPPSLRLVLLRKLSYLPSATLQLLRVAAVLGESFEPAQLALVTGRSAVDLLPDVEGALRLGVLGEAGARLVFRHDLLREALYQDLAPAIRRALHLDVGRALAGARAPAIQVAEHFAAGASPGDRQAVRWLRAAAQETLSRAPATAAALLQRALDLAVAQDSERDAVATELVVARLWSGRSREAEALAREILAREHDPGIDGAVRLHLVDALGHQDRHPEAVEEGRLALGQPGLDARIRAQLLGETAYNLLTVGDLGAAVELAETAEAEGEQVDDDRAVCFALDVLALVAMYQGRPEDAVDLATRAAQRAALSRSRPAQRMHVQALSISHYLLAEAMFCADRPREAEEAIARGRQASEEAGNVLDLPLHQWLLTVVRFRSGQWDDALAEAEAGFTLAAELETRRGIVAAHGVSAMIALHRNELGPAGDALARGDRELAASAEQPRTDWLLWAGALVREAEGDLDQAVATLQGAWDRLIRIGAVLDLPLLGPDLVRLLLAAGERDRAMPVTERTEEAARRLGTATATAAALRCRGLVDADPQRLAQAVAVLRDQPFPLLLAQACEAAASEEDVGMLEEALHIYEGLGAARDAARAEARLRSLGVRRGPRGRHRRARHGWGSLTSTELAVVSLVAEGLTNREAGQRLFISPRTVETHVSHVFTKLGLTSRAALKAEAARRVEQPQTS